MLAGLLIGIGATLLVGLPAGWLLLRRSNERVRRAERLQHDAERLAQIGAMTGGLAHEIKNPLSTIGLNAQLIAEAVNDLPIDEQERGRLTRRIGALRREVDRLRDILDDFLRLAGSLRLEPRPIDLNILADELADFYAPQAESQGVRLRTAPAQPEVMALADPRHLKQAVLNLMLNATQAMSAGRESRSGDDAALELILRTERRTELGQRMAALHVIDTGPGIPQDKIKQIFSPYFSMRSGGAGLGLSITRRIIEEHGGRIDVNSEVGRGSDFTIVLPAPGQESDAEP